MMRLILLLIAAFCFNGVIAQEIIEANLQGRYTADEIQDIFSFQGLTYDVDYYVVSYATTGTDGNPDTAGAVVAVPVLDDSDAPFLVYHHGTVNNRFDVPSLGSNEANLGLLFGSLGYISLVPDYIGMSSSRGYHPYLHVETQARASTDLMIGIKDYFDSNQMAYQERVFLTGYSQGGHASASTHRTLQENPIGDFEVVAASHLSGPYSLSGVMWDLVLSDEQYFTAVYIPHLLLGLQEAYGNLFADLDQVFKAPYSGIIAQLYNDSGLFAINQQLVTQLIINEGRSVPKLMFQDSVLANLQSNENHPIRVALRDNDLYDWVPDCPTRLIYCTADEQVNFRNAVVTDSIMNAAGAEDVLSVDVAPDQNHGGCVTPAIIYTIAFFQPFIATDNDELEDIEGLDLKVYGEDRTIVIESNTAINDVQINLSTVDGSQILNMELSQLTKETLTVNQSGMLFLTVRTNQGMQTYKVFLK